MAVETRQLIRYRWINCLNLDHNSYEGTPKDGTAWLENPVKQCYIQLCDSWYDNPRYRRAAYYLETRCLRLCLRHALSI